jgi:hypothetical protein
MFANIANGGEVDDCAVTSSWFGDPCLDDCSTMDVQSLTSINILFCGGSDTKSYSDAAYGRPGQDDYDAAVEFMCENYRCQDALVAKYAEFHGERNMYSSIIKTLCFENTCSLEGVFLSYPMPAGSSAMCCFSSQIVAHVLLDTWYDGETDLSPFDGLCTKDVDVQGSFGFSCTETIRDEAFDGVGAIGAGTIVRQPQLTTLSFQLAQQSLCNANGCAGIAQQMLYDLRAKARSMDEPVVFHLPLEQLCMSSSSNGGSAFTDAKVCSALPFAEYLTIEPDTANNGVNTMSCCDASAVLIAALMSLTDRDIFETQVCPAGCEQMDMNDTSLAEARSLLQASPQCFATTWEVVQALQSSSFTSGALQSVDKSRFEAFVESNSICWLQWSLGSNPIDLPSAGCEAADVVFSRQMWTQHPAIALDVYADTLQLSSDEGAVALALSVLCETNWGVALDAAVGTLISPFLEEFSFQALCNNPCRCKTEISTAIGCNFHPRHAADMQHKRTFCYVVDPATCAKSSPSVVLENEAWVFCDVGRDTCQGFSATGPCAAFIPEGVDIFVPAGATIESLQSIPVATDAAAARLDLLGHNPLQSWLQEAALVSSSCYSAHGQLICDSRLRRCKALSDGWSAESRSTVVGVQPQPVCKRDCTRSAGAKMEQCGSEVIFNDLLREFEVADDGETTVCSQRLLPVGFNVFERVRLREIMGIDRILQTQSISSNVEHFGHLVYANGDTGCHSSEGSAIDLEKALVEIACPNRFISNAGVQLVVHDGVEVSNPTDTDNGALFKASEMFCVGPCPSIVLTDVQYWALWILHTLPGMVGLSLNMWAVWVFSFGKVPRLYRNDQGTIFLVRAASLAGLFGVVPLVILRKDLLCTCDTELCLRKDWLCYGNQLSIYMLLTASLCLTSRFAVTLNKLRSLGGTSVQSKWDDKALLHLTWVVPFVLAMVSFAIEDGNDNDQFHLARAGVKCQFRYKTMLEETLLLHLPMCVCACAIAYFIAMNLKLALSVMVSQKEDRTLANLIRVVRSKAQLKRALQLSCFSCVLIVVWVTQTLVSTAGFVHYFDSVRQTLATFFFFIPPFRIIATKL